MINPDSFYDNIGARMQRINGISSQEAARMQHLGHFYNHEFAYQGKIHDNILGNIERMLKGEKKHGFEQNKKTELEKLQEKGKDGTGN